jgi:hypothetical protein
MKVRDEFLSMGSFSLGDGSQTHNYGSKRTLGLDLILLKCYVPRYTILLGKEVLRYNLCCPQHR